MTTPFTCPACGAPMELDPACVIESVYVPKYPRRGAPLPRKRRTRPARLCTGCDYCVELPPSERN